MRRACLCKSVEFEVTDTAGAVYQCHRSLCRKQTGAADNAALLVDAARFSCQVSWIPI
jgi:hypothetical protein